MKFKCDENLGASAVAVLVAAGHDACTVVEQGLTGWSDERLIRRCGAEERCLVTLDAEFANPLRYPPRENRGVILLRLTARNDRAAILSAMTTLRDALASSGEDPPDSGALPGPDRQLWIVQPGRVRVYQSDSED